MLTFTRGRARRQARVGRGLALHAGIERVGDRAELVLQPGNLRPLALNLLNEFIVDVGSALTYAQNELGGSEGTYTGDTNSEGEREGRAEGEQAETDKEVKEERSGGEN